MMDIPGLSLRASMAFLRQRVGVNDASAIKALSNRLACAPFALELAAAYINQRNISIDDYRRLLIPALDDAGLADEAAANLSLNALSSEDPEAYDLLKQAAWFSPDDIPLDIIQIPAVDASVFMGKVSALQKYSLIEIAGEVFKIGRLIQAVIQKRLTLPEQRHSVAAAIESLNKMFPSKTEDYRYWPACSRLLPHVVEVIHHAERLKVHLESAPRLLNQAALYELRRGQLSEAERMLQLAIEIGLRVYGPSHHKLAKYVSNLSGILKEQGNLDVALDLAQRALQIDEAVLGEDHVQVAVHSGNLGQILQSKGDLDRAFHFARRALETSNRTQGEENPQAAVRNYNVGQILRLRGDFHGAREFCSRALQLAEKHFGSDHPKVADFAESLARIYWSIGDLISAEHYAKRAVRINEQFYGEEHWKFIACARHLDHIVVAMAKRTNSES
jgi:tetratricopeptide (TPR) repeat protein